MPETAPSSPSSSSRFNPSVPDLTGIQQEPMSPTENNENLATVTDISEHREYEGRRRGRPPAPEPAKMDITRRRDEGESAFDKVTDRRASSMSAQEAKAYDESNQAENAGIEDIVKVDIKGRGHRPDGKFLSEHEMDLIEANADLIRNNTPVPPENPDQDQPTPEPTPEEPTPEEPTPEEPTPEEPTPEEPTPEEPTPEEPTPEEGGPNGPEGPEGPGAQERYDEAVHRLGLATERFARARVNAERMFGGKNEPELQAAAQELQEAHREMCTAIAEQAAELSAGLEQLREPINQEREVIENNMAAIRQRLAEAQPDDNQELMINNLRALEERLAELATREAQIDSEQGRLDQNTQARIAETLIQVRTNVDAEMLAEQERTSPALARMAEWLRRHPKTRIFTGLALVGAGFLGAVTGNVPLVVGAMAARAALSAFGGYNASRGVGEMIGNRRYGRSDTETIEGYTEAAQRQSRTRRRSKKTGAVVGAAAAAVPIIKGVSQLQNMTAPKPPVPVGPKVPPAPEPPVPIPPAHPDLGVTDGNYPWTHFSGLYGAGEATPRIMAIANNAPNLGWQVIGNGQGGGAGAILRVIAPDGFVYEGNGPINAALDHLDSLTPR